MIIDFHTHTFPDRIADKAIEKLKHMSHTMPFSDGTAGSLMKSMLSSGVDLSVVLPVATSAKQVHGVNEKAVLANKKLPLTHQLSFGCMHPGLEKEGFGSFEEEMIFLSMAGIRGIKLHPVYQYTDADDPAFVEILRLMASFDMIAVFHAGADVGFPGLTHADPAKIARALEACGGCTCVLAHMGGWRQWEEAADIFAGWEGVYIDTSFSLGSMTPLGDGYYDKHPADLMDEERFLRILNAYGADRVLFGTDSPWGDQAASLAQIRTLPIEADQLEKILSGNAKKLLGLEEP